MSRYCSWRYGSQINRSGECPNECRRGRILTDEQIDDSDSPLDKLFVTCPLRAHRDLSGIRSRRIVIPPLANAISSRDIATRPRWANYALQVICFECFISERVFRGCHISQPDLFEYNIRTRDCRLQPVVAYTLKIFCFEFRRYIEIRFEKRYIVPVFHH